MAANSIHTFSYHTLKRSRNSSSSSILFGTQMTCKERQSQTIMQWMQNSVFCLQPPGDTASRKSFYDAITCGCIPVTFELPYLGVGEKVEYPFYSKLNYSKFTVHVPADRSFHDVLEPYRQDSEAVKSLQYNLAQVAQYLQYNDVTQLDNGVDAFHMIMSQVREYFS